MKTRKSVLQITQNITAVDFTLASSRRRAENNYRALRWCGSAPSDVRVKTHLRGLFSCARKMSTFPGLRYGIYRFLRGAGCELSSEALGVGESLYNAHTLRVA